MDGPSSHHGGTAALEALRRAPCELILLDVNLPDQTGLLMLARARQESLVAATQVVVLSANVMPGKRRAAGDASIMQFLQKPFRLADLKRILDQAAIAAAQSVCSAGSASHRWLPRAITPHSVADHLHRADDLQGNRRAPVPTFSTTLPPPAAALTIGRRITK